MATILKDIGAYKSQLIRAFTASDDICELLLGKGYNDDDLDDITYSHIYPYLYVDDTQDKEWSYLCIEVDIPRIPSATIKDMKIIVWAYCHKKIMKFIKKGCQGTRVDALSDMAEKALTQSEWFGIGKLHLDSVTYMYPTSKHYGRQLIFTVPDFKVKR